VSVGSVIDILLNCCVYVSSVLILLEKNLFSRFRVQVSVDRYFEWSDIPCFCMYCVFLVGILHRGETFWSDLVTVFQNYGMTIVASFYL